VSRTYGSVPLRQKAEALTRFPRFDLTTMHTDGEAKRPTAGTRGPANSR
jgi:hypothetical protein